MAAPAKGGSLGAKLTRKVGPLPMWTWLALGLVATYYLYKRYSTGSSANATTQAAPSSTAQPATDTTGLTGSTGTSGDMTGAGSAGVDPTALLNALGAQNSTLQASLLQSEQSVGQLAADQLAAFSNGAGGATTGIPGATAVSTTPQPGGSNAPTFSYKPIAISTANFAQAAVTETRTAQASGHTSAFGGVTQVIRNAKTGVVSTHYANGRIVEQAPGKTAYVASTGKGHMTNATHKIR